MNLAGFNYPINAFVTGANRGLGLGFVQALLQLPQLNLLYASCRQPDDAHALQQLALAHPTRLRILALDITRERDFAIALDTISRETDRLHVLLNVAGVLNSPSIAPERRLENLNPDAAHASFAVNTLGPALAARTFLPLLSHAQRAVFASLSARVGSIADNRLGGWYSYRMAKAAQNQFTRTFAIEAARRAPQLVVAALHPGTVDTELSRPFANPATTERMFTVEQSVALMMQVINDLQPAQTGRFWAYDGSEIPW